jgi:hypothetical protein
MLGWSWSILGLILGAFIAPSLLAHWRLLNSAYQDWAIYAIAALSAFTVQLISFGVYIILTYIVAFPIYILMPIKAILNRPGQVALSLAFMVAALAFLAGESYALWWFITTHGTHQGLTGVHVLGAFIATRVFKTVIIGSIGRWLWKRFKRWIGVEEDKA